MVKESITLVKNDTKKKSWFSWIINAALLSRWEGRTSSADWPLLLWQTKEHPLQEEN